MVYASLIKILTLFFSNTSWYIFREIKFILYILTMTSLSIIASQSLVYIAFSRVNILQWELNSLTKQTFVLKHIKLWSEIGLGSDPRLFSHNHPKVAFILLFCWFNTCAHMVLFHLEWLSWFNLSIFEVRYVNWCLATSAQKS